MTLLELHRQTLNRFSRRLKKRVPIRRLIRTPLFRKMLVCALSHRPGPPIPQLAEIQTVNWFIHNRRINQQLRLFGAVTKQLLMTLHSAFVIN